MSLMHLFRFVSFRFDSFFNVLFVALKIHITAEMNDELASIGGFKTEHRGLIDVKVSFDAFKLDLRTAISQLE